MRNTITKAIISVGCCLFLVSSTFGVELVIPTDVSTILNRQLGMNYNRYQVDMSEAKRVGEGFQEWVLQSLDFDVATRRQSERFGGRETFFQELEKNIPVFMYDTGQSGLPNTRPVPIIYRKSANRFSFRKLLDVEAQEKIPEGTAVEMAGSFLSRNNFVKTTQLDQYLEITFPELRQDNPPEGDLPERDVLIWQRVQYRRKFLNDPVINSGISIDFHPDTLEVLGFKHYNWTQVNESDPVPVPRSEIKTRADVEEALRQTIREFWSESQSATLTSVAPMWFQTGDQLIPLLYCQLERAETGCGDVCTHLVNIAGSDLVFRATPKLPALLPVAFDCFPSTNPAYNDWVLYSKPSCWCNPYQCDGDADGRDSGFPFKFRVFSGDLTVIVDNWRKKLEDLNDPLDPLNPCADVDHKDSGFPFRFRVFSGDLSILIRNWRKRDSELPGNCPRPE